MEIKKILVPVDFSQCSTAALKYAVNLARKLDAKLDVLHVLELPHYVIPDVVVEVPGAKKQKLTDYARSEASKDLRQLLQRLEEDQLEIGSQMTSGYPRDEIIAAAESGGYDMIIMGTHGRTGLSHLFLGSVAEQIVRRSPCAVLTIRSQDVE